MALSGTIGDFGLAEIFQLIGMQRKTGILSLEREGQRVMVKFLEGNVVEADTGSESLEDRLGSVLVRSGKISEAQLEEALRIQKRTLQRLGHILVQHHYISEEELVEGLRVQSLQIIYRLFRWRDGRYDMQIVSDLDYDDRHTTPIASETILMEGARMIDEWPMIERRIRNDSMVVERSEACEGLELRERESPSPEADFDHLFDDGAGQAAEPPQETGGVDLSDEEQRVLRHVDGERTVRDITDRTNLGEFDTQRVLCELMVRGLVREVVVEAAPVVESSRPVRRLLEAAVVAGVGLMLALAALASLVTLPSNPLSPWRLADGHETTERLRVFASHARLERLETALQVHFLDRSTFPSELIELTERGYVKGEDLFDPWGRPFGYALSPGGYQLFGLSAVGTPASELSRSHTFSPAERMVLGAGSALP